jgi:hypothetical protein
MDRRQALKNIGFGAGIIVVGPTTLGLLQSCKNEPNYNWQPQFLSAAHGLILEKILDVIIPTGDTPGAIDVNVAQFIDKYMFQVAAPKEQREFKEAAGAFSVAFKNELQQEAEAGETGDFERIVEKFLRATPTQKEEFARRNGETQDPMDKDPTNDSEEIIPLSPEEADAKAFAYLRNVRGMGIWGWKTSKEIGENVLWYDPVPGEYIPCAPVKELGNGKAMSL